MVKLTDLKEGDLVQVIFDGEERPGRVVDVSRDNNMVCVNNGVQDFWYAPEDIVPIPLTGERLESLLGFVKEETPEGMKYKKDAFRVLVRDPGNNTRVDIWYREDHRHFEHPLYLHELQNHHLDMTKVHLEGVETH
jgi:hypothetical protein